MPRTAVADKAFNLVELSKVRLVQRLIPAMPGRGEGHRTHFHTATRPRAGEARGGVGAPEDAIDRKVLFRGEHPRALVVLCHAVEHPCGDRRGVGPQDVLPRLLLRPLVLVPHAPVAAVLVNVPHPLEVVLMGGVPG